LTEQFKKLLETFPEGIIISKGREIKFFNSKMLSILHVESPVTGNELREILHDKLEIDLIEESQSGATSSKSLVLSTELASFEEKILKDENKEKAISVKFEKIIFENEMTNLYVFKDNTLIQKIEKAEAESKYKEILMTTVTHELRTPVNGIKGNLELLKDHTSQDGKIFIKVSLHSCDLLINLINDILVILQFLASCSRIFQKSKKENCV
jgi:signal transduction histidine kinase